MRVLIFIATVDMILSIITYTYLRLHFQAARSYTFLIVFIFLMLNMVVCRFLPETIPLVIAKASAWLSGLWIAVMYYILLLSIIHGFIHILDKLFCLHLPHLKIASTSMACLMLFIIWGTFRAFTPTTRIENIETEKLPSQSHYKIVLLTDLHLGQVLGRSYSEKLVEKVNQQKPDIILIAGDLLDEKIRYVERENSLEPLAKFKSKYGTYMAFGNHDYLDRPQLWQAMLETTNIHVLRDKDTIINNELKITGLNDWSRVKGSEAIINLSKLNNDYYSIIMDHQPRRITAAANANYDLYLAGHTHTGQLMPNRQITKMMYALDYGRAKFASMEAITSNGYGFWGPPVRTEVAPEMIIINIKGK